MRDVAKDHPTWTKDQQVQGGIACYNFGRRNVRTPDNIDKGTTGGNYSKDVLSRQQFLKNNGWWK